MVDTLGDTMKKLLFFALLAAPAYGQINNPLPNYLAPAAADPACGALQYWLVAVTTNQWRQCFNGTITNLGGSGGTVTSVTFTGDGVVDSSTPSTAVTTSGTVAATLNTQAANTVFGNFTGGVAAPTFSATPTFAATNLTGAPAFALTNMTGTLTSPTLVTPALGTPTSGVITNLSGTCATCVANTVTSLASPPAIGGSTPAAATFTTITGTGISAWTGSGTTKIFGQSIYNGTTNQSMLINGTLGPTYTGSASLDAVNISTTGTNNTKTGGTFVQLAIRPTYDSSSTAADSDLLINRTETAIGSGVHDLIEAQTGAVDKFVVDRTGFVQATAIGQIAASNTGGTCAMSAGTSCTITIAHTYTTPVCIATQQSATLTGGAVGCTVSGTTVTITSAVLNSETWGALVFGNPN